MLTDLHCHLLPGIDDGSRNVAQSIEMAQIAVADGIGTTILTPHPCLAGESVRSPECGNSYDCISKIKAEGGAFALNCENQKPKTESAKPTPLKSPP